MEIDSDKLLTKVNSGKGLSDSELNSVVSHLEQALEENSRVRKIHPDTIYNMLLIIGKARAFDCQYLLERYLSVPDPLNVALVIKILCEDWNQTEHYVERIIAIALGMSWDDDDDARLAALLVLGEYVEGAGKKAVLDPVAGQVVSLLLSVFNDEDSESWTRKAAYVALCKCAGVADEQLPHECAHLDFSKESDDVDWEMISRLESMS